MKELSAMLAAFLEATGCEAAVWLEGPDGKLIADATSSRSVSPPPFPPTHLEPPRLVISSRGEILVTAIPGPRNAWLAIGPCTMPTQQLDSYRRFLLPVVTQYLQSALEVEHAATELAERYEEINLLYTISEILGRAVKLEETAATILEEISATVGARRASILVHDRVTDTLQVVAALGLVAAEAPPISVDDERSVSARVFREQHLRIVEEGEMLCEAERSYRKGAMMSVPIMWTAPTGGSEPLGVVNLSGRQGNQPFTAGDQKLMAAIATQIGTAIQNARLVRASLNQQKLVQEMQLAHDLQMKLLPRTDVVAPGATVAARVMPADSVGGDFYHLFRLDDDCTGVMIGDVSSHGYRAALIMALAMSASAIHAQRTRGPAEMLDALLQSVSEELVTTEMFISVFYGVIDRKAKKLHYANTGHPHAFVIDRAGTMERLPALDPPLGMVNDSPKVAERDWAGGTDLLVLFTDGISDARDRLGKRLGEQVVLDLVCGHRAEEPAVIVDRVFDVLRSHIGDTPLRDDLTLVVLRS